MKTLVVCYSNSGTTMSVAECIAQDLGAVLDAIEEVKARPPLIFEGRKAPASMGAFMGAALSAVFGRGSRIAQTRIEPSGYDLVVVGTPVWAGSLAPAVRSYLKRHRKALRRVAFFCSAGDPSKMRVFGQMRKLAGKDPIATIAVRSDDARTEACPKAIGEFVVRIKSALQTA